MGVASGIENGTNLNAQVYVNAANQFTIIAPVKSNYAVYSAVGQKQYENSLNSTETTINKPFGTGVFFIAISVNDQREIQKVVIC